MDDPLADWDFELPPERVRRVPLPERDGGRLLVLPAGGGTVDSTIRDLPTWLREGDLLVVNDTRVMAARLAGTRPTGGRVELLVLAPGPDDVPALVRPARRIGVGDTLRFGEASAIVCERSAGGRVVVRFDRPVVEVMAAHGAVPLPPYLGRRAGPEDEVRYQTVFAGPLGASAAPTAGLHLSERLLAEIAARGVRRVAVTLHVGEGTFRPPTAEDLDRGELHAEPFVISAAAAEAIADTRARAGRVIAVGTTVARALETATDDGARAPRPGAGVTRLLVRPPYRWRTVDALLTNFHLPRSSLLMLVAARVGRDRLFEAYRHAIDRGYGFYSYGDAMLCL